MDNRRLLNNLKKIKNDSSYITNLTNEELNEIYTALLPTSNESNNNQKGKLLTKKSQYYSGEENNSNNNFIHNNKISNKKI